jgi:transposase
MTCDFLKEALKRAFSTFTREEMKDELEWIIQICMESEDKYLARFANLINNHMDGILSYTEYHLTSGKIEGINNKIKTIRRMHYGIPDDNYFFLMLLDINRKSYPKHPLFKINGRMVFGLDKQVA